MLAFGLSLESNRGDASRPGYNAPGAPCEIGLEPTARTPSRRITGTAVHVVQYRQRACPGPTDRCMLLVARSGSRPTCAHPRIVSLAYWHHPLFDSKTTERQHPPAVGTRCTPPVSTSGERALRILRAVRGRRRRPASPTPRRIREFVAGPAARWSRRSAPCGPKQRGAQQRQPSRLEPSRSATGATAGSSYRSPEDVHGQRDDRVSRRTPTVMRGPRHHDESGRHGHPFASFQRSRSQRWPVGYTVTGATARSSTGSTASQTAPISAAHVYTTVASSACPCQ